MRIAYWHNLPSGGGKRALYDHVKGLVDCGHHVEAWCPSTAGIDFLPLKSIIPEHVLPLTWPVIPDRGFPWNLFRSYQSVLKKLDSMRDHCIACAEQINNGNFDILISHPCASFATSPIGQFVKIPKIIYLAEPYRKLYEAMPTLPWQAMEKPNNRVFSIHQTKRYLKDIIRVQGLRVQIREEQKNAAAYDRILVNSFFSRESVLRAYGIDAKVCYLGIDTVHFDNRHLKKENFLIGVGSFTINKNIEFIIKAVAKLSSPKPRLIWVGNMVDRKYMSDLVELATALDVVFIPKIQINDQELIDLYNSAKVMVYAPRLEPFGFTPLEANACGTPVVAVAEGGVRETVIDKKNGFLVENSEKAMAEAIQTLLDQSELAITLGEKGRKWVEEKWALEPSIQRLLDRIYEVIPENRP
jgi:glycosyltransferase involved in cell wall biosynthesis